MRKTLKELSQNNLKRIEDQFPETFSSSYSLPNYEISHETSLDSTLKILKSGKFLSLDSLVRKGLVPPSAKLGTSLPSLDGRIGEQDVVFLAIRGPNGSGQTYSFGRVSFQFKRSVLKKGYFTFLPFGIGSHHFGFIYKFPPGFTDNIEQVAAAIPRYRSQVFTGQTTLEKLILLMQNFSVRLKKSPNLNLNQLKATLGEIRFSLESEREKFCPPSPDSGCIVTPEYSAHMEQENRKYGPDLFTTLFTETGVSFPDRAIRHFSEPQEGGTGYWRGWERFDSENLIENLIRIKSAPVSTFASLSFLYQLLPSDQDLSYIDGFHYGFWEFKVPESLSIDEIDSVRISTYSEETEADKIDLLRKALKNVAKTRGKVLRERRTKESIHFYF